MTVYDSSINPQGPFHQPSETTGPIVSGRDISAIPSPGESFPSYPLPQPLACVSSRASLDRRLSRAALRVLLLVASLEDSTGWVWHSQAQLAGILALTRNTVGTALRVLVRRGYVERATRRVHPATGAYRPAIYRVTPLPMGGSPEQVHP